MEPWPLPTALWHSLSPCGHCPPSFHPGELLLRVILSLASTQPGTRHARSCLRSEQPASQNAFCRVLCPQDPKNLRVRIEVSLRWVYSLLRILFASPVNCRPRQRDDGPGLASPHLPPASDNGTFGVTAWIRLTDFCNPHFSVFKDEHPPPRAASGLILRLRPEPQSPENLSLVSRRVGPLRAGPSVLSSHYLTAAFSSAAGRQGPYPLTPRRLP